MSLLSRVAVLSLSFLLIQLSHGECDASSYTIDNGVIETFDNGNVYLYCNVPYLFKYTSNDKTETYGYMITCGAGNNYMDSNGIQLEQSYELCRDCRTNGCGDNGTCTDGLCVCDSGFYKEVGNSVFCSPDTCDKPVVSHATLVPDKAVYNAGTQVTINCDDGYIYPSSAGESSLTTDCQGSGSGFSPTPLSACLICDDDNQCTNGKCSGGDCVCETNFVMEAGSTRVCEAMVCPANHCGSYGECKVENSQYVCTCKSGASGDDCKTLAVDPCINTPCKNGGACSRDTEDAAQEVCTCDNTLYNGDSCQFWNSFHLPVGSQIKYSDFESIAMEFSFVLSDDPMLLLMFKADDNKGAVHKGLIYISTSPSGSQLLYLLDPMVPVIIGDLNTAANGAINKIKLYISSGNLYVSLNSEQELTIMAKDDTINGAIVGGGDCLWDDVSDDCLGESRWFYTPFVGSFTKITIGEDSETSEDLQAYGAVSGFLDCTSFTCENGGTCDHTSGDVTCTCQSNTEGRTGFACDKLKSPSFNGYSSYYSVEPEVVNMETNKINMKIVHPAGETGTVAVVYFQQCTLHFEVVDGSIFVNRLGDMEATGVVSIKDGKAYWGLSQDDPSKSVPCVIAASPVKYNITVSMGGVIPETGSEKTIADSHFQGCIVELTFNGKNLLVAGWSGVDIDTEQCVTDLLPESPCGAVVSPCQNSRPCSIDMNDYSAVCDCEAPYNEDVVCGYQDYCEIDTCNSNGTEECHTITEKSVSVCKDITKFEEEICDDILLRDEWFYFCTCNDKYEGLNCDVELSAPAAVTDNTTTTVIIVVVVVVGVIILVVVAVLVMRSRRSGDAAKANGKTKGEYKPQAEEKLEMGTGKNGDQPPNNIYDEAGTVLKNPTAESEPAVKEVEAEASAPAELAVTVEPEDVTVEAGTEQAAPDHI